MTVHNENITNLYDPALHRPRLAVETVTLYAPTANDGWTYSHHPHITFFQGRLYAIWSNGRSNEDDAGQRVLIASSEDFHSWTEPQPLMDSTRGRHSDLVLTAAGFHRDGNTLVAYYGQYEYKQEQLEDGIRKEGDQHHMETGLYATVTRDGVHWEPPVSIQLPIIPNHGPQPTRSGRLLISGNTMFPYTDDPSGLSGWQKSGIYPPGMEHEICDDSESIHMVKEAAGWPNMLCEGSFFQTGDGTIHMLLRSSALQLWVTRSRDDGTTWSPPEPTGFTDNNTKFHFGMLPDSTYYYVGSPDPLPRGHRNPLVLSLSDDGAAFRRHFILKDDQRSKQFPGMYKNGQYGYPHSLVHDGYLYVIYSVCKEQIEILRVPIETI